MSETVELATVIVEGRHRRDFGDIDALARSIDDVGLLQPIVITPDRKLIAGQRRLVAVTQLGHDVIEAHVVYGLDDAVAALRAERDENTCRKRFTPTEEHDLYVALLELERDEARERMTAGKAPCENFSQGGAVTGKARQKAAAGATGKAGRWATLDKVGEVKAAAEDESVPAPVREVAQRALEEMDRTGRVDGAHQKVKAAQQAAAAPQPNPAITDLLANDRTLQDLRYVHNFIVALGRDSAWLGFDPERLARLIDDTELRLLVDRAASADRFVKAVQRARTGLRLINGGAG